MSNAPNEPKWEIDSDLKTVTITFPTDPPAQLRLDLQKVEVMIQILGRFRSQMKPDVPFDHPVERKVDAFADPKWYTQPEAMVGDSLLHTSDPRFGWLNYLIPRAEAAKLSGFL